MLNERWRETGSVQEHTGGHSNAMGADVFNLFAIEVGCVWID